MKPLCIDLFCGLGGWAEGFLTVGYDVVGFDITRHVYGEQRYPAQLVLQDVLTLHGAQFRNAAVIVASPPCQKYSWLAMPWSRSKDPNNSKAAKALRLKWETEGPDNRLFDACFRIQREAIDATRKPCGCCAGSGRQLWKADIPDCSICAGKGYTERFVPLIVENVRGAQPWVGRSAWNYGSFHLWGDVPALMPINLKRGMKRNPDGTGHPSGSWFAIADSSQGDRRTGAESAHRSDAVKNRSGAEVSQVRPDSAGSNPAASTNSGDRYESDSDGKGYLQSGRNSSGIERASIEQSLLTSLPDMNTGHSHSKFDHPIPEIGTKNSGGSWFAVAHNTGSGHSRNPVTGEGGTKIGGDWFSDPNSTCRKHGSRSSARKAASAQIAKIPYALSLHIAEVFKPRLAEVAA